MIQNIFVDFGGVLTYSDYSQALSRFAEIGVSNPEKYVSKYRQEGIFGALEEGGLSAEAFRGALSVIVGREVTIEQCSYAWTGFVDGPILSNLQKLSDLRSRGYRISLLSNTNPFMMAWAMSPDFDGSGHGLMHYLDSSYLSYLLKVMKPDPAIFRYAMDQEGAQPENSLFIDDSAANTASAATLGMHTFTVGNGEDWSKTIEAYL